MSTADHPLHPLPNRLAALLVKAKDRRLGSKVEAWMGRQSKGLYAHLHTWLDDEGNVELRRTLGERACRIIESGHLSELEE